MHPLPTLVAGPEASPPHTFPASTSGNTYAQCECAADNNTPCSQCAPQQLLRSPRPTNPSSCRDESSTPTSRPLPRPPLIPSRPIHHSPVAETEPAHISLLWNEVASYTSDTTSQRGRRNGKTASTISGSAVLVDTPSTSEADAKARKEATASIISGSAVLVDTPSTSEAGARARKEATAKVSDADFANTVLDPYGIKIHRQDVNKDLRTHFCREDLPDNPRDRLRYYRTKHPLENIWLEPDTEHI